MTPAEHGTSGDENTPADEQGRAPRLRRRHRRATRPAQGGEPLPERSPTSDDTDEGWGEQRDESAEDRWLRAQRPPHWS